MRAANLLRLSDLCARRAYYSSRWNPPSLTPKQTLYRAIEFGLESESDDAAENEAYRLATEIGLDTAETDLLGLACHIASLADLITWILRQHAWRRPERVKLSNGSLWESSAFLSQSETHLRRIVLVDRWDAWAQTSLEHSWDVAGECSVYGVAMDCLIVQIGSLRNGRWHTPLTMGYRHPVAKTLRFRKRDGEDFGPTWEKVFRENDGATKEQWLDALTEDGVLADVIQVHSFGVRRRAGEVVALAQSKLERLLKMVEVPEENRTICFDKIHPCPFRNVCPRGLGPSPETGFLPIT
jgi:hypothetical protein